MGPVPAMKVLLLSVLLAGALAAPSRKPTFRRGLNKIVGGTEVEPSELPYQLSFQDTTFGFAFHFCGASIYNENWAVCAGHCVQGEDYNGFTISNDVSVLQLSESLTFNSYVQAIPLAPAGHAASGECIVSGWGTTSEGGSTPSTLRKVSVPIVSDAECRDAYGDSEIDDSMICAGVEAGDKDSCQGDSGGPLACSDTGSPYLAGIVSWGYGCARPNYPGVYTEVAYFVDWIETNTA